MPSRWSGCKRPSGHNLLTVLTVCSALAGIALGFILRSCRDEETWWTKREVMYVAFPGELFLQSLTMFVLPLLITAVISGIASLDLQTSWQVGARSAAWFVITQYMAVVLGILVTAAIRPGIGASVPKPSVAVNDKVLGVDSALDVFRNILPENLVLAMIKHSQTVLVTKNSSLPIEEWTITVQEKSGVNIPGLITLAIAIGVSLGISMPSGRPVLEVCEVFAKSMMIALGWFIWCTPVAVIFMVAAKLLVEEDLGGLLERLGLYFITVLVGLFIHGLIIIPAIYFAFTRKSPFKHLKHVLQALATAFGTASSNAALPLTIDCLENRAGLDSRLVRFFTPVATNLSLNGTALYEAVAIVFISQLRDVPLGFANYLLISVTVTAACLGQAGVPQAGLITMVLLLATLNLPPEDVTLIVAVDWLLDRFRTTVNVAGVALATGVIEHLSQNQLSTVGRRRYSEVAQTEDEEYELNMRM